MRLWDCATTRLTTHFPAAEWHLCIVDSGKGRMRIECDISVRVSGPLPVLGLAMVNLAPRHVQPWHVQLSPR